MKTEHELAQENFNEEITGLDWQVDNGWFYHITAGIIFVIWALTIIGSVIFYG